MNNEEYDYYLPWSMHNEQKREEVNTVGSTYVVVGTNTWQDYCIIHSLACSRCIAWAQHKKRFVFWVNGT